MSDNNTYKHKDNKQNWNDQGITRKGKFTRVQEIKNTTSNGKENRN